MCRTPDAGISAAAFAVDMVGEQVAPAEWLDGKHVVFGAVTQGMSIVKQVEALGTVDGAVSNLAYIENCGEIARGSEPPPEPQWYARNPPSRNALNCKATRKSSLVSVLQGCCNVCPLDSAAAGRAQAGYRTTCWPRQSKARQASRHWSRWKVTWWSWTWTGPGTCASTRPARL